MEGYAATSRLSGERVRVCEDYLIMGYGFLVLNS